LFTLLYIKNSKITRKVIKKSWITVTAGIQMFMRAFKQGEEQGEEGRAGDVTGRVHKNRA
jgi:hypothetical protein